MRVDLLAVLSFSMTLALQACAPEMRPAGDGDGDDEPAGTDAAPGGGGDPGAEACGAPGTRVCVGREVHTCQADGSLGPLVETCADGCSLGACATSAACGDGAELIYVVTDEGQLLSFQPAMDAHTFTPIGTLACPAGPEWPARGGDPSHPYSMSVDRSGMAWVLYTSGELFRVSTGDAACQTTGFVPGAMGFELFGMAFVADQPGASSERLYIAGGTALEPGMGKLGSIDPATLAITPGGALPGGQFGPELSGTGAAELFAYYPGQQGARVGRLDKQSAVMHEHWPMPAASGIPVGWAFAHWGGRFYVFVTEHDLTTISQNSKVYRLDPQTGQVTLVLEHLGFKVLGAGVSTCAPVVVE